jgi:hypothetical protein
MIAANVSWVRNGKVVLLISGDVNEAQQHRRSLSIEAMAVEFASHKDNNKMAFNIMLLATGMELVPKVKHSFTLLMM